MKKQNNYGGMGSSVKVENNYKAALIWGLSISSLYAAVVLLIAM